MKLNMKTLRMLLLGTIVVLTSCEKDKKTGDIDNSTIYKQLPSGAFEVTDLGEGTGTMTWKTDSVYILNGFVFVNEGQTLTVEPGTIIKGKQGSGEQASALIVARGAKIEAVGTAEKPIIMTSVFDSLTGNVGLQAKGLWGGLIVLGKAGLNTADSEQAIEGVPTTETRGLYGGSDDADNSGTIKYVSIRHGGSDIGSGNEINGLTLGGVGSGTTIDYVEVISNKDDGIEFFGGAVNVRHALVAYCGDDSYDYDQGYRGKGQFWVSVADPVDGDRAGEHDGGTDPEDGTPYATPTVYNATYVGRGISEGRRAVTFRDNAGGAYSNSIFFNFGKGIDVEDLETSQGEDSYNRFVETSLLVKENIFWDVAVAGAGAQGTDVWKLSAVNDADSTAFDNAFSSNNNSIVDPGLSYNAGVVNLVPSNAVNVVATDMPTDNWFETVTYKGAFDPAGANWAKGWTRFDEAGMLQ